MLNKSVLITGATSGIGLQTAKQLSKQGYSLILVGRNIQKLESDNWPTDTQIISCDFNSQENIKSMCENIKAGPHAKTLYSIINNAGVFIREEFFQTDLESWQSTMQVNLLSCVQILNELLPLMINNKINGQSVVNIASTAGYRPVELTSCYSATKAAMISLTQTMALEFAKHKIRFNCICPGIVDTPIHSIDKMPNSQSLRESYNEAHPIGRMGQPEDIANAIEHMISDQNTWLTGNIMVLDGGLSLKG